MNRTVLLLEDELGLARAMTRVLEREGYRVLHAADAQTARALVAEHDDIDLLVADLILPGLSGREAANHILAHRPEVRVLFTTGFSSADPELRELVAAGFPVLRKPYTVPNLLEAVSSALAD